jgi:hypothetical protein
MGLVPKKIWAGGREWNGTSARRISRPSKTRRSGAAAGRGVSGRAAIDGMVICSVWRAPGLNVTGGEVGPPVPQES